MHTELLNSSEKVKKLYKRVQKRDLLKKCYTVRGDRVPMTIMKKLGDLDAKKYEYKIAEISGVDPIDIFVVTPSLSSSKKLNVPIKDNGEIKQLNEISDLSQKLPQEKYNQLRFHVYSKEDYKKDIQEATNQALSDIL
jgi:HD superfamily phosphohydrolase